MRTGTIFLGGLAGAVLFAGAAQAEIIPVDLNGVVGVSADGTEVAGTSVSNGSNRAFRWTQSGGAIELGYLGSVAATSYARSISANGLAVVGASMNNSGQLEPFRWHESSGMAGLGFLPNSTYGQAYGVSADGGVVVGRSDVSNVPHAFRWTSSGMTDLGTMTGGSGGAASAVSGDGDVVVGCGNSSSFGSEAFIWTQATGMNGLGGALPSDTPHYSNTQSCATAVAFVPAVPTVSDAYTVVAGTRTLYSDTGLETQAFRWSEATGKVGLGFLPGDTDSNATGISADGRVVVGQSSGGSNGIRAFRWTYAGGMQSVADWLAEAGISSAEWQYLYEATATNGDGSVIVGNGRRFSPGNDQGWLANLDPPPPDTTPADFNFVNQAGVARSSEITSASVTITGINTAAAISVTGGEYSIDCDGTFTASDGNISNDQTVCVRHTSSASFSTATDTTLTVGGVIKTFTSTTAAQDTTPNAFSFADQPGVAPSTPIISNAVVIGGLNDAVAISVSGAAGSEYSIGCTATFTATAGTITSGQTVCVRHTSSASNSTATNTVLTVGGVSDTFTSTTAAAPAAPGGGGGGSLPSLTLLMLSLMTGLGRLLREFAAPRVSLLATGAGTLSGDLPMPEAAEKVRTQAVVSLVLVSDDARFRSALQAAVSGSRHLRLDAAYPSAAALRASGAVPADRYCLIDVGLPDVNGIELLRELKARHPSQRVAALMPLDQPHTALVAICSGAEGLIEKDAPAAALIASLARFAFGEAWFSPRCAAHLLKLANHPDLAAALPLSLLQRRVLRALCSDHHRREDEVAQGLDLKLDLVRACLRDIRDLLRAPRWSATIIQTLRV